MKPVSCAGGDETILIHGEAIFTAPRRRPETGIRYNDLSQTTGVGHVGIHHQSNLPPVLQKLFDRHAKAPVA